MASHFISGVSITLTVSEGFFPTLNFYVLIIFQISAKKINDMIAEYPQSICLKISPQKKHYYKSTFKFFNVEKLEYPQMEL